MNINLQLHNSSQPIEYKNIKTSYEKGNMYCFCLENGEVHKYPVSTIFRVVEDYGYHSKREKMKRSHLELAKQLIKDTNATLIECLKALDGTDGNFEKAKKFLSAPFSFFQKSIKNESTDLVSEVETMTKPKLAMQLRKETDACMFECMQALKESDGDYETAKMIIRQEIVILPKYEPRKIDPNKPILSQDSHDVYKKHLDGKPDFTHLFLGKLKPESNFVAVIYNNKFIRDYSPEGYIIAGSDKIEFDPIVFECEDNLYQRLFDQHYFGYKNGHWIISAYEVKNGEIISKLNHQYDTRYCGDLKHFDFGH